MKNTVLLKEFLHKWGKNTLGFARSLIYPSSCVCCHASLSFNKEFLCESCFNEFHLSFEENLDEDTLFYPSHSVQKLLMYYLKYPSARLAKIFASYIVGKCLHLEWPEPILIVTLKDVDERFHLSTILHQIRKFNESGLFETLCIETPGDIEDFFSHRFAQEILILSLFEDEIQGIKSQIEETLEIKIKTLGMIKSPLLQKR